MNSLKKAEHPNNSKQLAKNTLFLYARMLFSMLVSLYTSRLTLQYLGVENYGIYNVIGGLVAMFGMISGTLSTTISRHLTYELGTGNMEKLKKVFSMSVYIQLLIIGAVLLLGESFFVWFLNNRMVIPSERVYAANWILQFSLITFSLGLFTVPYSASIIAHEKMKAFAYIGIIDVLMKLIIVYLLTISPIDVLVFYGFLLFIVAVISDLVYIVYCKKKFEECSYKLVKDRVIFKELIGFAMWNFIGSTSSVLRSEGVNILLNMFFGPIVNAARGIAMQVNNAINSFVTNFMTALTPQITKSYAQKDFSYLLQCIYRGSKFSYLLLFFLSLPVIIETDYILNLWLVEVPETTTWFVRFVLLFSLTDTLSRPMINANNATGDIKTYQIVIGSLNLTVLPIAYICLKLGAPAESTVLVSVIVSLIGIMPRIYFNKKHFPISYKDYFAKVLLPILLVSITGSILPIVVSGLLPSTFVSFLIVSLTCVLSSLSMIFLFGCTKGERMMAVTYLRNKIHHDHK